MLNLGGSRRARLVAACVTALAAFAAGSLMQLADAFAGIHEDRGLALPPIKPDPRVQIVAFDSVFFERNPGPLTVAQVADVATQLREVSPAVVAFNLPIARNLQDPALAAAVDGLNYVDLAEGEVFKVGGDWRFDPADGPPEPGRRPSGVGIIPTDTAYWRASVPLTFVTLERDTWVPSLATAAVREYARVTGTADPTLAHNVDPSYRPQWPQPKTRYRAQDRYYALREATPPTDHLEVLSVDEIASQREQLEGKIVFVSVTMPGSSVPTAGPFKPIGQSYAFGAGPRGGYYTSVALQSNVAAMLFAPPFHESNWPEVLGWSLTLALAISLAVMFLRLTVAAVTAFGLMAAWWMLIVYPRFVSGLNFEFEIPALVALFSLMIAFALKAYLVRRDAHRLSALAEYVPPAVVMALMGPKKKAKPSAPVVASVLYTDVRGYTTLAGQLDASRVKEALDVYYSVLGGVVSEHLGSLLYYAGDGMVVTFEADDPREHAERAVACGAAMQAARSRIAYTLGKLDLPPLEFGVGIHTGEVIIGAVGSEHHRQFTALGEAVNIASRMCAVAEGGQVCLTEQTRQLLATPPPLVDLGELQLKNVIRGIQGWRISEVVTVG